MVNGAGVSPVYIVWCMQIILMNNLFLYLFISMSLAGPNATQLNSTDSSDNSLKKAGEDPVIDSIYYSSKYKIAISTFESASTNENTVKYDRAYKKAIQKIPDIEESFISYTVDPKKQSLVFYWKDNKGVIFSSIQHLKTWLGQNKQKLLFATNGGMYKTDHAPLGLYIENKIVLTPLNTSRGTGNFYLKPNGVFYITTDNIPLICKTTDFRNNTRIKYATQSGPLLVIDGNIHASFKEGSANVNIRNGVGILPDNRIVFAMSKKEINFYDFANYFKSLGCKNALYLDGFVSRTYLPEKNWVQTDGDFGVMIGVVQENP